MNEICIHNGMRPRRDLTCISIPPPFRVCVGGGVCVCVFVNGRTTTALRPSCMPLREAKLTALPCSARRGRSDEATTRGGGESHQSSTICGERHTHTHVPFSIHSRTYYTVYTPLINNICFRYHLLYFITTSFTHKWETTQIEKRC